MSLEKWFPTTPENAWYNTTGLPYAGGTIDPWVFSGSQVCGWHDKFVDGTIPAAAVTTDGEYRIYDPSKDLAEREYEWLKGDMEKAECELLKRVLTEAFIEGRLEVTVDRVEIYSARRCFGQDSVHVFTRSQFNSLGMGLI